MGRKRVPGGGGGGAGLGRALIKERNLQNRSQRRRDTWLHTKELDDGGPWGRSDPRCSVTEPTALEEFLATAELAGTEFVAEKLNVHFVPPEARTGLLSPEEKRRLRERHEELRGALRIPRRPPWDKGTSAERLQAAERENFLEWRRQLGRLEEEQNLILTPFERNLDFWRQLWRVIERSDIVVQIVDARNPLLFRCEDLERYVKEVSRDKENVILVNKADMLTEEQRGAWARFFEQENVKVIFWSALAEGLRLSTRPQEQDAESSEEAEEWDDGEGGVSRGDAGSETPGCGQRPPGGDRDSDEYDWMSEEGDSEYEDCLDEDEAWQTCSEDEPDAESSCGQSCQESGSRDQELGDRGARVQNDSHLVEKQELLDLFREMHSGKKVKEGQLTVGLVGYPNVGKSSTINTIFGDKKVSVSATPGHTKHFQTLYVEPGLCLCDCPGLVMPSFVSTKADMVCCGILPIDQLRDHVPPISLICQNIPRHVLEATYGIHIIRPREDEDPDRQPTSEELLTAYGSMRGFMTAHGQPDQPRAARYILKDYVRGKLLYCHPPPGIEPGDFQPQHEKLRHSGGKWEAQPPEHSRHPAKQIENVVDRAFFHQENVRALTRGVQTVIGHRPGSTLGSPASASSTGVPGKPWKKHGNRNKKEKIRRVTRHLEA
ncbi:large subunit GTPase 1 homolog [Dromiciops gliroides]|uniref:large subunit GTPase 1 homolog n=1 Tax=Dromiciops gliroides TaxID=33562 RepID=UPI001CC3769E|nr:large subunit GTPase 1 homolog [Dromiciops gliroides]